MPKTSEEILASIAPIEENRQESLARAAEWRAKGREDRAATWDASAERYARLIESKKRIAQSAANIQAIKERITAIPKINEGIPGGPPKFTPPTTATPTTTATPSSSSAASSSGTGASSAPSPKPPSPPPPPPAPGVPAIKTAPIDTVLFNDDLVDQNILADLLFEDVGGQEILTISRYDTVNGQDVSYQPIKNLNLIQQEYNPNNLVKLQATSDRIFANFPIKLADKIPVVGNGPNGENIYLDSTGSIVIELINLVGDEQVEVQIASSGTIYEAEI
jgi:hypothetical protein